MGAALDWLRAIPAPVVLAVLGTVIAAESGVIAGVVLPGASGLLALGFLAQQHTIALAPALLTGAGAALTGSTGAFLTGRRVGADDRVVRLAARVPAVRRVLPRDVDGRLLAAGQWLVGARTVLPRIAGSAGLPYARFALWSVPSAVAWGSGLVLVGWLVGESFLDFSRLLTGAGVVVLAFVLLRSRGRKSMAGKQEGL
ncbi:DedA family protein [Amycolatopsis sp. H20-H5]|uniref:DedA family protein n=1 Tax=Amycolatopsis sp. H20-H5 TaxID=3046309 RepID=UPI002DBA84BC|nr:DedA family protein [Amycolatopsis sp. H20-H5]MEC3980806.1 DedA family protein [Amycolatopsis sp. H20-H5]